MFFIWYTLGMLIDDLKALHLEGDIASDEKTLSNFSHDASLFEIKPEVVVYPKNVSDIEKIVSFARENKGNYKNLSITPRAAGTDMSGGPLNDSIILEFNKYFNHFIELGDNYAVTEPGVFYRDFEKKTLEKGLILPPFPASRELCAVGGMVANNGAGEKTLHYGKIENFVMELSVVFEDGKEYIVKPLNKQELDAKLAQQNFEGELYRKIFKLINDNYEILKDAKPNVSKNSAGYYLWNVYDKEKGVFDLTKLIVGSQGTLGLVTKIKFRLEPTTTHSKLIVIFLKDLKHLADIVNIVLPYKPETFESFDDNTFKLAMQFFPEMIKVMKPKHMLKLAWEFIPEMWMALTGGFPKLAMLAEFTGNDENEINARMEKLDEELKRFGAKSRIIYDEQEASKYWVIRHESFNLLRNHTKGRRTAPCIDDIVVRPEFLPEFLPELNRILAKYNLIYTIAGHVGDGNFHIIPLMDFNDPKSKDIIKAMSDEVFALVCNFHGSITGEHNDGLIRSPYLKEMYGPRIYELFEETKKIFDPNDIFNPRKKVGATMDYALEHLVKQS